MKHERNHCDVIVTYRVGSVMAHAVVLNGGGVRGGRGREEREREREPRTKQTNNNLDILYDILFQ